MDKLLFRSLIKLTYLLYHLRQNIKLERLPNFLVFPISFAKHITPYVDDRAEYPPSLKAFSEMSKPNNFLYIHF